MRKKTIHLEVFDWLEDVLEGKVIDMELPRKGSWAEFRVPRH